MFHNQEGSTMKALVILISLLVSFASFASAPSVYDCGDEYTACGKPGAGPGVPTQKGRKPK
jgi:hypothetical protein